MDSEKENLESKKNQYRERLDAILGKSIQMNNGIKEGDLNKILLTSELKEILSKMVLEDILPSRAIFVIEGLVKKRMELFGEFKSLVPKLKEFLLGDIGVRTSALGLLYTVGYSDLKQEVFKMTYKGKVDAYGFVFKLLQNYGDSSIIEGLFNFKDDPTIGEFGGMGGELRYQLRDLAFETIECLSRRKFPRKDLTDLNYDESNWVKYLDWSPILEWWDKSKSKKSIFSRLFRKK